MRAATNQNDRRGRRIVITGASGFIGLHLCRALLDAGDDVHAMCRSQPRISDAHLSWHKVDLTNLEATRSAFWGLDADQVFHLCSYAQGERELGLISPTFRSELQATINVLTTAMETNCKRLITAGSLEEPASDEAASSPYAAAKAASRIYARMFHRLYRFPIVMTRIFMVYGPGQPIKKLIPHSISTMLRDETLRIGSPERKVDWIYVDDLVRGLLAVASTPGLEGKSVDLGSGKLVKIREVVETIQSIICPRAHVEFAESPKRAFEQVRTADQSATYALTRWSPEVALDAGLRRTVDFFSRPA